MSDEEIIGQTEGSVAPVEGQAQGSEQAVEAPIEGSLPETVNPTVETPKPTFGEFGDDPNKLFEGYKNLETKLGNWKETEELARLYREGQNQPVEETPEEVPDFQSMTQEDQLNWLRQDARKEAEKVIQEALAKEVKPLQQDVYARQAKETLEQTKAKYPDFDQHKEAIGKFLDDNPAFAANLNEKSLEIAYKYVTYEKAKELGAKDAISRLSQKASTATPAPAGTSPVTKSTPKSFAEALRQAEEEAN